MAKRNYTTEQLSAIETRDRTLLVSAAAGSGKTATLTERIIRSLTDPTSPEDISRMLIVTFTNAAVREMRERITAAVKAKLLENKDDTRLEHQLYMLPGARISTIDSFCNDILKQTAEKFGISPRYRIADPIEAKILSHSVWSALIEAAYNGELTEITAEAFFELAAALTGVKSDDALEEIFEMLYERSKSDEAGAGVFRGFANAIYGAIDLAPEENKFGAWAIKATKTAAEHFTALYAKIRENAGVEFEYLGIMADEESLLSKICRAKTYGEMQNALLYDFPPLPRVKEKTDNHLLFAAARDKLKAALKRCRERYFTYSHEEWRAHLSELYAHLSTLAAFIERFDAVYFEEKRQRGILEYSDIERLTYQSLYNSDGSLTELAYSLKEQYSSVYIDEYQDVNSLQNKIFDAVSGPTNRFMVGDIKQSIYGFRSARPDIFADMKAAFPPLEKEKEQSSASIFMSKNFRCDKSIVDFVNDIFDPMFTLTKEAIGYVSEDKLEFAKSGGDATPRAPEVCLFAKSDVSEDSEEEKSSALPPIWVAEKIKELLNGEKLNSGEPIRPRDIAIILRKDASRSEIYSEALAKVGIKARVPDNKNFFFNSEIQLVLCLLNAIDNPRRDVYLTGVMLSPLYNFTADELYLIKQHGGGATVWESLRAYLEEKPDFEKGKTFVRAINKYRAIAEGVKVDALIMRLYNETGILALASRAGCEENLMLLYNYARKFESSSLEGLYSFINYVNTVINSGAEFSSGKEREDEDAVSIITVHKSKGLEFPVVFLADAATSLVSARGRTARVVYSDEMGPAMRTRVPGGLALVESPVYNVVIDRNVERSVEEELRVYYVALTRARERLYITGAPNVKSRDDYEEAARLRKLHVSPYTLTDTKSFIDVLYATNAEADVSWGDVDAEGSAESEDTTEHRPKEKRDGTPITCILTERFAYKYPDKHLSTLPEKMSISKLSPTVLDEDEDGEMILFPEDEMNESHVFGKLPSFITGTSERESALRGIATHNFLQFFDMEKLIGTGVQRELSRLVDEEFISKDNAGRVRIFELELFLSSPLFKEMREAKKLLREFRFSVMLPAVLFTGDEEKRAAYAGREVLLQGVIDCITVDANGDFHLIDYKTDRLTKEELKDKKLARKKLAEKHKLQLYYYALAIKSIFGKAPKTVGVYSLPLGDTVDITEFMIY
ncbi:MAG: UvrD-helicase domain-containing protein [Clostridia bacterium]|nr:UvrD-helicase domain-containing protein [Clostridia bacterium]